MVFQTKQEAVNFDKNKKKNRKDRWTSKKPKISFEASQKCHKLGEYEVKEDENKKRTDRKNKGD